MVIFPLKSAFLIFFSLIDSIEFLIKFIKTLLSCSSSPFISKMGFVSDKLNFIFVSDNLCRLIDREINLNNLISRSLKLHELSETDIKFVLSKEKSPLNINGDEEQLNRVFVNLIKNSIESINEKKSKNADFKGKITIDIKADSDYIYVTIVDNGVGFDQADKSKMITPYYTTKKKGTGLGLAIVTKVISDHNSTILFDSVKNGAKVEILFPKYNG